MLKMALIMTVIVSSSTAYALNNSDLIQLSLRMSRQQEQSDVVQMLEPVEQARLRQEQYQQELLWKQQEKRFEEEHHLQEVLWERQRRQEAQRIVEERGRDIVLQRAQSGLFQ